MEPAPPLNLEEYSASSTIITFDRPIPLLRGPIRAGSSDDPAAGPFVLAFRDPQAWQSAYKACRSKMTEQCDAGARIGCSISASNKCKPPWWSAVIGWKRGFDLKEREQCEAREMEACLAVAKEKCVGFAKKKCLKPFMDARIALSERRIREREAEKWVCRASMANSKFLAKIIILDRNLSQFAFVATNYQSSRLFRIDNDGESRLIEGSGRNALKY